MSSLIRTTHVAIAAYMHGLGQLVERAGIEIDGLDEANMTHYPAKGDEGRTQPHRDVAHTAVGLELLAKTGAFPDFSTGRMPFNDAKPGEVSKDTLVNAAAVNYKPDTYLQWLVATSNQVAYGVERGDGNPGSNSSPDGNISCRARLLTLFEQIGSGDIATDRLQWTYPLRPLAPDVLFPLRNGAPEDDAKARKEYQALWGNLLAGLQRIPKSHQDNLPLWFDHFDSLWLSISHAIPASSISGSSSDVSLYDHSKTAAAVAAALYRWHLEVNQESVQSLHDWQQEKLLLIQGDFAGIQSFIFADGQQTNKHAHKLLRGRSFQVSLLTECAALCILDTLGLPSTSQIINAAGKFLVVAPNTESTREAVEGLRLKFDQWCLENTYGEIGIVLATTAASCNDLSQGKFSALVKLLFESLDEQKFRRFNLVTSQTPPLFGDFLHKFDSTYGVCKITGKYPADPRVSEKRKFDLCVLSDDQITIGEQLTKKARVLVTRNGETVANQALLLDYFGWRVSFVNEEEIQGKFGGLAKNLSLLRCWDFDGAEVDGNLFRGYARRFVNSYVPMFDSTDQQTVSKYGRWEDEAEFDNRYPIKTLQHIACEDRQSRKGNKWQGEIALVTLKGDIDNLGSLFQHGFDDLTKKNPDGSAQSSMTFAKWAALSRQINLFFALWLPWFCEYGTDKNGVASYRNTYTVFAGGDDFFLIGPWKSTIKLAGEMREKFDKFVVNERITFSAGMVMTQPRVPARQLAMAAEDALDEAKAFSRHHLPTGESAYIGQGGGNKNAVTLWRQTVPWESWSILMQTQADALQQLLDRAEESGKPVSSGFIYSLLQIADRADRDQPGQQARRPEDSLWRSQLAYITTRLIGDRGLAKAFNTELTKALQMHRGAYRLPLSVLLYSRRE